MLSFPGRLFAGDPDIPIDGSPIIGVKTAPVRIVMFIDYECPECRKAAPVLRRVLKEYGGNVALVLKTYPYRFREHSYLAAQALFSAWEQGLQEEMHDLMLDNSPRLDKKSLLQYGFRAGMDTARLERDLRGMNHMKAIERDILLARDLNLYSTPVYFINGMRLIGNQPYEEFKRLIDKEFRRLGRL